MKAYSTLKSKELFEETKKWLVNGVASSAHKAAWQEYPIYISHGKGSKLYDVDGNEYVDYMGGYGPMILGYAHEGLNSAVFEQMQKGSQFAAPTESLIELSSTLVKIIPSAEKVTYVGSGTEANMHAFRLARAYTGKDKIVKFEGHYHGWSDEEKISIEASSVFDMGPRENPWRLRHAYGQRYPEDIIVAPYNDIEYLEQLFDRKGNEIAGVILETVMCNAEPVFPKPGFLKSLRELTKQHNIVMIFDEVITGFRLSLGGAQQYFGVTPDLSTFGKAIAGGFPMAAVVGKEEIIASSASPLGTFNGNPVSVAAAIYTLNQLQKPNFYSDIERITNLIVSGIVNLGKKYGIKLYSRALTAIWTLQFGIDEPIVDYRDHFAKVDKEMYRKVYQAGLEYGVRFNPFRGRLYVTSEHTEEDVKKTLEIMEYVFASLNK